MIEMITAVSVALITSVFGPSVVTYMRHKLSKPLKKIDPLKEALNINNTIDEQLEVLMYELGCDQVWIAQFHNGGHFYPTGKSIQKFSIFYEKISNNHIVSLRDTYQNVPVSIFNKPLSKLSENHELLIPDVSTDVSYGLETFCAENAYKSCYLFSLNSINGKFIGVLGVYYTKKQHNLTEEEMELIRHKASAIGTILNAYLYEQQPK
jgi:GAF domain-containing protein